MNPDKDRLAGKIAIVSAAGRGIGQGIAKCLAAAGATVIVNSYGEETTANTVDQILASGGTAIGMPGDITSAEVILDLVARTIEEFGKIDILVNNLGGGSKTNDPTPPGPLGQVEAIWNTLYRQNLLPTVLMTEAVTPHMIEKQYGKIVHISSIAGRTSLSDKMLASFVHPSYGAMKAALINYTHTLAETLGPHNINVNSVCPGIVYTDAWKGNAERAVKTLEPFKGMDPKTWFDGIARGDYPDIFDRTPLRRDQTVKDIGNAVEFLVSENSMNITGQSLMVDGGMVKI